MKFYGGQNKSQANFWVLPDFFPIYRDRAQKRLLDLTANQITIAPERENPWLTELIASTIKGFCAAKLLCSL
jgi:hypothetical protein